MLGHRSYRDGSVLCHLLVASTLVSVGTLLCSGAPLAAHADLVACRSDPVISLSNGITIDLSANINDGAADVQQVAYSLHIPKDVQVVARAGTDGLLGLKEVFTVVADALPGIYASTTVVTTGQHGVAVTAEMLIVPALGLLARTTAQGTDQQRLSMQVTQ